jgi:transcriptional regulator with XRE-family HTH domain
MENDMSNKAVGRRVEKLRVASGVESQRVMAELLGVDTNRYNNWANGVAAFPVPFAVKLCAITGATLDYVFRGDESGLPIRLITLLQGGSRPAGRTRGRSSK